MRLKRLYRVITFATTTDSMAAEKFCMDNGIGGRLIPVPQEISAGCGLAWRMTPEDFLLLEQQRDKWSFAIEASREIMM